ncbi:serine/threonine-protein kinase, partial [Frankia canadensis]|uniref:serine/threonine-protein kinase n=1 Tax=Frankia canadensis TaxID=1836972 RepID=UPI00105533D6
MGRGVVDARAVAAMNSAGSARPGGFGSQRSVTERVADALPAYDVTAVLGHGGHAVVLAGRHRRLGRSVAIKVLSTAGSDGGAHGRFLAEARVLAGLDHPHIVGIYDYVESADLCLLVMERLAGGSARTLAANGLTVATVAAVGLAACAALRCAHDGGILHRDVKPDNMLFTADGLLKVTDFGIAKLVGASGAAPSTFVGTPVYMAPEQFDGRPLGPACDLYALGVVLYELLSGRPPFARSLPMTQLMTLHLRTPPPPLDAVPPAVAAVVARALAKD